MKNPMLIDTSIWIEYFKENEKIIKVIEKGLMENNVFIAGPVVAELLQGVKSESEFQKLANCIDAVPFIDNSMKDWKTAGEISFKLRRNGITIPLTDIIISALAINNNLLVYTRDEHFKEVPGVKVEKDL